MVGLKTFIGAWDETKQEWEVMTDNNEDQEVICSQCGTEMRTIKAPDEFVAAYIRAIYFTDTGDIDQPDSDIDLDLDTFDMIKRDCEKFFQLYGDKIPEEHIEQAGHDFWLTRNGYGVAKELSEVVGFRTNFPELSTYESDDGLLCLSKG